MMIYRYRAKELDIGEPPERTVYVETQWRDTCGIPFWWVGTDKTCWNVGKRLTWDTATDLAYEWGKIELRRRASLKVKKRRVGSWWP